MLLPLLREESDPPIWGAAAAKKDAATAGSLLCCVCMYERKSEYVYMYVFLCRPGDMAAWQHNNQMSIMHIT